MSKYIIEIEEKPLCVFDKDTQTYFPRLWRVKGFNSLVLDEEGLSRLDELNSDYINEHYGSLQDDAYRRGFEDGKAVNDKGCEGCRFERTEIYLRPCSACRNAYLNQWTAKQTDDKIKVRDEVIWTQDENVAIVVTCIYTKNNMEWCDGVCKDGKVYSILTENARKTGGRFDIDKYLEEINRSKIYDIC